MLTGSFASAFYGLPRATQDIDLVIEPTGAQLTQFLEALSGVPVYVSPVAARDALDRHSQFNVIDLESGWKIDLIVRKERPFSRVEFDRRIEATIDTRRIPVATAEDVFSRSSNGRRPAGRGVRSRTPPAS
ncbi:MAG TPA: hypothetical protein VF170_02585 [Planctomycetaceae bacterium]